LREERVIEEIEYRNLLTAHPRAARGSSLILHFQKFASQWNSYSTDSLPYSLAPFTMAAFCRSLPRLSKRITIPLLSPSHTQARILSLEIQNGAQVEAYDTVMRLECSPDFVTEAFRKHELETVIMMDTQEEGVVRNLIDIDPTVWLDVGTPVGIIDDGEEPDGDWLWQANLD
jgi:hypothetical protein